MKTTRTFLAAAVLGAVVTSLAFTIPSSVAAAGTIVTGWQTGYSYHQGLANGDGAMLIAAHNRTAALQASNTPSSNTTYSAPNTGLNQSNNQTSAAPVMTSDGTALSASPQASQSNQIAQAAAPSNQSTYGVPATGQAASPGFIASLTPLNWIGIGLIALAIIIGLIALATQPGRSRRVARSYQHYE